MKETRLRLSAVVVGLIFVAFFCALTPVNNIQLKNSPLAGGHFPLVSFAVLLFLMAAVNPVLSRIRKGWGFHLHELLLIWSMVTVATGIAYTGLFRTFVINITSPAWFSTAAGGIGDILKPFAPGALFPNDPQAIGTLYNGLDGGYDMSWWEVLRSIPWKVWSLPLLSWGVFILMAYAAMLGMVGIFSHQWIENEKMSFPLLKVPEILSEEVEKGALWSYVTHKYFLIGLAVPVILHLFNGLHNYYPQVPQIPNLFLAQQYVPKDGLLSGFYRAKIYIYPAFIGFAYLTSNQVSFSLWGFFILGGLLPGFLQLLGWRLPAAALGTTFGPVLSQVEEMQMIGAFGVFFFFILWLSRQHLVLVVKSLASRRPPEGVTWQGLLEPQFAARLFALGVVGMTAWMAFFGVDVLSAVLLLGVSFMLQLVAARLICQGGLPYFTLSAAPSDGFLTILDTRIIPAMSLYIGLVAQKVTFLDMREALMPSLFHSSELSRGSSPRGRFFGGVVCAILLGIVVAAVAMLALYYKFGISALSDDWAVETARRVHEDAAQLLTHP
ncbi:MAG: DUF6785 family protein, partial [Syntrophobacteraceae bacterium]